MKKILYAVSTLKKSGPIIVLSNIIKYLDRTKFEPIVLTLSPEPIDSMQSYFELDLGVTVHTLGLSRIKGIFFAKQALKDFIEINNINLIHSHGFRADLLTSGLDISKVSTLHNYPYYDYIMKFGRIKGGIMAKKHIDSIKKSPQDYIACSKTISREFKNNNLDLRYIQNGVDTDKFYPLNTAQKNKLREKLSVDKEKVIYITVGSLIKRKDMTTIIEAFNQYDNKDALLLVAGDGEEFDHLQKIANNRVRLLGNISNVIEYLQISDYFISASLAEGLPNTVLEAMASGLPCLLSNIPSHLELYEGIDGCFFDIKNTSQLTFLLKNIKLNALSQKETSLRQIDQHFSAEMMSKKYQQLYEEKINGTI